MSEQKKLTDILGEISKELTLEQIIELICFADDLRREECELSQ